VEQASVFGREARFHHVGLAVRSIRDAWPSCTPQAEVRQGVSLSFLDLHGVRIELLEPLDEDSPIEAGLRHGATLLHLCFEVPDLEASLQACRPHRFHRLRPPVPTDVFHGRRVVWVYSKALGLFELLET